MITDKIVVLYVVAISLSAGQTACPGIADPTWGGFLK